VVIIACAPFDIRGATCTGKTTLAKHLRNCLPGCYIAHQDDFAPPVEKIPIHPEYNVQDWDDAPGAIDWPRLRSSLAHIKATGKLPDSHTTHDHWNKQTPVPIREETIPVWLKQFEDIAKDKDEDIQYVILEGFLLYWDKEVMDQIDVRIMLRIPHDVLRQRREGDRREYITAGMYVSGRIYLLPMPFPFLLLFYLQLNSYVIKSSLNGFRRGLVARPTRLLGPNRLSGLYPLAQGHV